jgi:hypothetical protein
MARPPKVTVDPFIDLQKKAVILEREMARQRAAMDRPQTARRAALAFNAWHCGKLDQRLSR